MRKETDKGKIRRKALCLGQKHVGLCAIAGCEKISFANGLFHLLSYLSNAPFRGASLCRGRSKKTLTAQEEGGKCSFRAATPGPHAGDAVPRSLPRACTVSPRVCSTLLSPKDTKLLFQKCCRFRLSVTLFNNRIKNKKKN